MEAFSNLNGMIKLNISGFAEIKKWTRESIRRKPFCLSTSKAWTAKPHLFPLEETYTPLEWVQRHSRPGRVVREQISDVTDLMDEKQLGQSGPVRVLVTGGYVDKSSDNLSMGGVQNFTCGRNNMKTLKEMSKLWRKELL